MNILNEKEINYLKERGYLNEYPNLKNSLNTPRFTMKSLGVTPRDATYWDEKGILPKLITEKKTRRKYTLKQAIWVKLIQQLRSFEVSINRIKLIKDSIMKEEISVGDLMKTEAFTEVLKKIMQESGHEGNYTELLNNPEFREEMENQTFDPFESILLTTIVFKRDASYIIFQENHCIPYSYSLHEHFRENVENFDTIMKMPHFTLSISEAVSELVKDWSEEDWFSETSLLTAKEGEIIQHLRKKEVKELTVFKKDNEPDRLVEVGKRNDISVRDFASYILKNGYQSIEVKTRNGKIVHVKNEVSISLNK